MSIIFQEIFDILNFVIRSSFVLTKISLDTRCVFSCGFLKFYVKTSQRILGKFSTKLSIGTIHMIFEFCFPRMELLPYGVVTEHILHGNEKLIWQIFREIHPHQIVTLRRLYWPYLFWENLGCLKPQYFDGSL